jgi:hypothetical protein
MNNSDRVERDRTENDPVIFFGMHQVRRCSRHPWLPRCAMCPSRCLNANAG